MRGLMDRRSLTLAGISLLGLLLGAPQISFAQSSNPMVGTWKLNLEKSKFASGPAPKSLTLNYQPDGQNFKNIAQGVDPQGNQVTGTYLHIYDGQSHPTTGVPGVDASAYTRVNANTVIFSRSKEGKLVAVGVIVISPDGKTNTVTNTGAGVTSGIGTDVSVFEKQ
jgi:hypothetical protein